MGWSGGVYTQTDGTYSGDGICQSQAGDGDAKIKAAEMDALLEDHADGINQCLNKDGSNAATGDLDAGSNKITNLAEGSATGDAARWDEAVASLSLDGTTLEVNLNDGQVIDIDLASIGSAGEVTLSGDQTITGQKTFTTNPTIITNLKTNGAIRHAVDVKSSSASISLDTDSYNYFYVTNNTTMTVDLDMTDAADDDLGASWVATGWAMFRNDSSAGAVTVTCANADSIEVIGSNPTTNGETYTLAYQIVRRGGAVRAQATWVTPS